MDKVLVFGRGQSLKNNIAYLNENYKIVGILDNAVAECIEDNAYRTMVYNPKCIGTLDFDRVVITSMYFVEMFYQIKSMGIPDEKIVLCVNDNVMIRDGKLYYAVNSKELILIENKEQISSARMKMAEQIDKGIIGHFPMNPILEEGEEAGKPIDRYYIEKFMQQNEENILGTTIEVQDDRYISKYGTKCKKKIISHVMGWNNTVKMNFETGEGIEDEIADCIICTQTLQYIYDLKAAIRNLYRMLKQGGTLLVSVPGIKPLSEFHDEKWGEYWSFTTKSMKKLCMEVASEQDIYVAGYGNAKATASFLYGINQEHLTVDELEYYDYRYPLVICARVKKF